MGAEGVARQVAAQGRIATDMTVQSHRAGRGVICIGISESPAALSNDNQLPQQMNDAVSRARLGINLWPLFGYYFAPVWGTIVLMARPGKPQFSSGRIFTERSNPSPSSGESRANLI